MFSPIRLLATLLGLLVIATPMAAVAFFFVAIIGSPGVCETGARPIAISAAAAGSFQSKWDQLNVTLDAGQPASATFSESEVTSRARTWLEERDAPISDLLLCFDADGVRASAQIDIPFFPGDVDVLATGTLLLTGDTAEADITDLDVGGLPGPLADVVEGLVNDLIENETEDLALIHDYSLAFAEGEVTISGVP